MLDDQTTDIEISGSVQDVMPLAYKIWEWGTEHYIVIMIFTVVIVALVLGAKVLSKRRAG